MVNMITLKITMESLLKDKVAICHDFDIEKMMKHLEERSFVTNSQAIVKEVLDTKAELSKLYSAMKNGGFLFAHIMQE